MLTYVARLPSNPENCSPVLPRSTGKTVSGTPSKLGLVCEEPRKSEGESKSR